MPTVEPRPDLRPPAQFVRQIEPMPKLCAWCKRGDGTHSKKCPRGKKRKPVTRRGPKATAPASEPPAQDSRVHADARALLRKRLQDELTETEAYATELRRVLAGV